MIKKIQFVLLDVLDLFFMIFQVELPPPKKEEEENEEEIEEILEQEADDPDQHEVCTIDSTWWDVFKITQGWLRNRLFSKMFFF